jgi:exopolysaccharide biosynthesis predicted pyruvyltransferase EpsI
MSEGSQAGKVYRFDAAHVVPSPTRMTLTKLRRHLHRVLDRHIPRGSPVALIDFPNYANVGDSAIWLGALEYLRGRQASIRYICDTTNYDRRRLARALRGGRILLNGGGNFGDLWIRHHELRLQVIRDFPHHHIIQLPQSIHFQNTDCLDETCHVLECHPKLTLLVRDRNSRAFALKKFNVELNLCPDMAFQLELTRPPRPASAPRVLLLQRTDQERKEPPQRTLSHLPDGYVTDDWVVECRPPGAKRYARVQSSRLSHWLAPLGLHARVLRELTAQTASHRLARGVQQLSQAELVITDRLHAHILCLLLNQRHVVVDNSYGKLSSFHDTWTAEFPLVRFASSWGEALELAGQQLRSHTMRSVSAPEQRAA